MADMPPIHDMPRMEVTPEKAAEIEAKLAAISSDTPYVAPTPVEDTSKPESANEVDPTVAEAAADEVKPDAPGSEAEPADKVVEKSTPETDKAEETPDAPTLPDTIRRSLIATGWTEEEITEQHAALGEQFEAIAQKVHQKRQDESREWAARGRMVTETEPTPEALPDEEEATELSRINVDDLKAKYGHDEAISALIDEMSGPMNASIEAINKILPTIAEQRAHQNESTQIALRNEINTFFGSKDLAKFGGFYGEGNTEDLPESDEFDNRLRVLQYADQLTVGASYQGHTLELSDALDIAHDAVSGDFQMQALREEMKSQMQTRANSITLKPSESGGAASSEAEPRTQKTREEMARHAQTALRQIFG